MKKIYFLVVILFFTYINAYSQVNTYYYKLVKESIDGVLKTDVRGGQFFTFTENACYESDCDGFSVGNGKSNYNRKENELLIYVGDSYYGQSVIMVRTDYSKINISHNGNIYVYERGTPPLNQKTCSLIRSKQSSSSSSSGQYVPIVQHTMGFDKSNTNYDTNTSKQKTKVRKKCPYCSGKGERIQHESVATFGLDGPRVYCSKCNQYWSYGTVHAHHKCSHCNGTGYYEYEY